MAHAAAPAEPIFTKNEEHIVMKICPIPRTLAYLVLSLAAISGPAIAADPARETVVPAFAYPIANMPGKTLTSLVVSYAPGAKTPAHRHGRSFVVGYVLEGAIRSKLDNGEERVYKAGESWTEKPSARHTLSENASATEPAKIFAMLIHDAKAKDLLTFDDAKAKPKK
jgi:quercetin dioxygenase-like cupin family protein